MADCNTNLIIRGTEAELLAMIKVLRYFGKDCYENYRQDGGCPYIREIRLVQGRDKFEDHSLLFEDYTLLEDIADEELSTLVKTLNGKAIFAISGPYGPLCDFSEVGLFEVLAEVAPNAYFKGFSDGADCCSEFSLEGCLSNGILELTNINNSDFDYASSMIDQISYSIFCKIAKIDKNKFSEDDYCDFYCNIQYSDLGKMDYDEFMENCKFSKLKKR